MKGKIGLDLGAWKCCVASVQDRKVTVLPNSRGDRTTPSFVAFDTHILVGSHARDQASINPANTVYGIRRILGRTVEEPVVQHMLGSGEHDSKITLPLPSCHAGGDKVPVFSFDYRNGKEDLRPEQIAAIMVGKMKAVAEEYLNDDVTGAVISVPVNFNTAQRQATVHAARIAGIENATLINSSTAAALAYWDHNPRTNDCIAVIDFGAGSLNLAIISVANGVVAVKAAFGDCTIGGDDIDLCMMSALVAKSKEQNSALFECTPKTLMRLWHATEKLKHNLSLLPTARFQTDAVDSEVDITMNFTRQDMLESCENVLNILKAGLKRLKETRHWKGVRCVVLVGGSTRIPFIQQIISNTLEKPLDQALNKDEVVACGAALRAAGMPKVEVADILGRRIWGESEADFTIFDFKTPIPVENLLDKLVTAEIKVCENLLVIKNERQERRVLCTIQDLQKRLLLSVDESGIFRVEIFDGGKSTDLPLDLPLLDANAISDCAKTQDRFVREETELEENENAMNDLEALCYDLREIIEKKLGKNSEVLKVCDDTLIWLEKYPNAVKKDCESRKTELNEMFDRHISVLEHPGSERQGREQDNSSALHENNGIELKDSDPHKPEESAPYEHDATHNQGETEVTEYVSHASHNNGPGRAMIQYLNETTSSAQAFTDRKPSPALKSYNASICDQSSYGEVNPLDQKFSQFSERNNDLPSTHTSKPALPVHFTINGSVNRSPAGSYNHNKPPQCRGTTSCSRGTNYGWQLGPDTETKVLEEIHSETQTLVPRTNCAQRGTIGAQDHNREQFPDASAGSMNAIAQPQHAHSNMNSSYGDHSPNYNPHALKLGSPQVHTSARGGKCESAHSKFIPQKEINPRGTGAWNESSFCATSPERQWNEKKYYAKPKNFKKETVNSRSNFQTTNESKSVTGTVLRGRNAPSQFPEYQQRGRNRDNFPPGGRHTEERAISRAARRDGTSSVGTGEVSIHMDSNNTSETYSKSRGKQKSRFQRYLSAGEDLIANFFK